MGLFMQKFTKIIASVGPACANKKIIEKMIASGVNVFRLNFSHDTGAVQGRRIDAIRAVAEKMGCAVGIMVDLQGPKHRIGDFKTDKHYPLTPGEHFVFDDSDRPGDAHRVQLPDMDVMSLLGVGERILLNDGKIEMRVENVTPHKITATVIRGTEIWSRRGFNLPDTEITTSVLTDKDKKDLAYVIKKKPDWVAVSFVQRPEDIALVRDFITAHTSYPIKILAKIERPQAVARIADIALAADGVMVARGDLAIEVPFETIPAISRNIIRICRHLNRPVVMATQMLGSMVESEFPTRAEISDVANAAYLRVDSTMTSEETTIGINPVHVVDTMSRILTHADNDAISHPHEWARTENRPENDWTRSVASMAHLNGAVAIVVFARDAETATAVSCRRPDVPIIAVCRDAVIANQLCLSRGVFPMCDADMFAGRDASGALRKFGVNNGKFVIVDDDKISLRTL